MCMDEEVYPGVPIEAAIRSRHLPLLFQNGGRASVDHPPSDASVRAVTSALRTAGACGPS